MANIKPIGLEADKIEQDFLNAFERLTNGQPNNKALKAAQTKGFLKITASNVALEAGRSRTLIGMENCKYPHIREMIKLVKEGKASLTTDPKTHTELIQRLRAEVADLRIQVKQCKAEATAHYLLRVSAEKEAKKERDAKSRLLKQIATSDKILSIKEIKKK
ncbi:MAG: hypothetical protein K2Q15_00470 [Burkholderiales bacterium]|nr:hypothetical protein [Burkholderiales bacterium]